MLEMEGTIGVYAQFGLVGVNDDNLGMSWGIVQQRCCGIDIERCAYNNEDIGLACDFAS